MIASPSRMTRQALAERDGDRVRTMRDVKMPAAEIDISADLVAALVRSQHPDLAAPLQRVANGWDNVIFRLGDALAVRLPRRTVAVALLENEQRWLPLLAPLLPVPTPVPVRQGAPDDTFPWPWSITPWFDGRPLVTLPVRDRQPYAAGLGRFLARLHTDTPPDAPHNPVRGIPLSGRAEVFARHLETIAIDGRDALEGTLGGPRRHTAVVGSPALAARRPAPGQRARPRRDPRGGDRLR